MASTSLDEIRDMQRARGTAAVLAIATVVPPYAVDQADYADYYFQVTDSEHMAELELKFKNICEKSKIKKRHFHLTKEIVERNPEVVPFHAPSLDVRRDMVVEEIPRLGSEAAEKAIAEWGRPKSDITHLVCVSTCGFDLPGMDFQIIRLLGLRPTVRRHLMYYQGCFAGGMVMRLAKDLAENNKGARVLVVSAEIIASLFRGPSPDKANFSNLIGQALFSDGAAAIVVGSDPIGPVEKPIFEIVRTTQTLIPASEDRIAGRLTGHGLVYQLGRDIGDIVSANMEGCLAEAFNEPLPSIRDWNSIFWIVHPGGPAILDKLEEHLNLEKGKLRASRHVLSEYGNMSSCTVMFVMDEMRRRSTAEGARTTGEGLDWGVLLALGPGLTVDTVVLRAVECARG